MKNLINFKIKDYGIINNAEIEVNKINIVGGTNSSGKSTASKLLYSFLRTFSLKEEHILFKEFVDQVNFLINCLINGNCSKKDGPFTIKNSYEEVLFEFKRAEKFFKKTREYNEYPDGYYPYFSHVYELIEALEDGKCLYDYDTMCMVIGKETLPAFVKGNLSFYNDSFMFTNNLEDNSFFHINFISDVFYIDSLSMLNLINKTTFPEHNEILLKQLKQHNEMCLDDISNNLISNIGNMINGEYLDHGVDFGFEGNNDFTSFSGNTSSGIKQIGIVQILLRNNLLKKNCYLIIDEPEVNLHPDWQFKFAEILVLIAMELDITLYINSHSPIFIESINAFCEFYDMEDDINYYLTKESENKGKYDFIRINSDELYKIYSNLGNPYHLIDQLRLRKRLGEKYV